MNDAAQPLPSVMRSERRSACAGAGKTHALTSRFIALLARTGDPKAIAALTFTRKSAGEFLDKILTRLAQAATDDKKAAELAATLRELGCAGDFARADFLKMLQTCARELGRMNLGTIDSFCTQFLGVFMSQTGVFGSFEVLDDAQAKAARRGALENVVQSKADDEAVFEEFSEAVKKASFGRDEKSVDERITELADGARDFLLSQPEMPWGDFSFFGGGLKTFKWDKDAHLALAAHTRALGERYGYAPMLDGAIGILEAPEESPGAYPTVLKQLVGHFREHGIIREGFEFLFRKKKHALGADLAEALTFLMQNALRLRLHRACEAARALREIALDYERECARVLRARGLIGFADVLLLLTDPEAQLDWLLCQQRLDAHYTHWLFDEFQDTSRRQWDVFKNLVDEALQDDSGQRTFFYVGDPKQSIYSWRGGDRLLFDEVFEQAHGRIVEGEALNTSWRSGPKIIGLVNALFGRDTDLTGEIFGQWAADDFCKKLFTPHSVAAPNAALPSFVRLDKIEKLASADFAGQAPERREINRLNKRALYEAVFSILNETRPVQRGKSCAILVGRNATARELAAYLNRRAQQEGIEMPVDAELELPLSGGGMEVPAFLQLLRCLAHPADAAALEALKMTPLFGGFARGMDETFVRETLADISQNGTASFARAYADFVRGLLKDGPGNRFWADNLERLQEACREFDRRGGSLRECIEFLTTMRVRLGAGQGAVQVMTIHKAKGLEFDMVVLPDLCDNTPQSPQGLCRVENARDGHMALYLPPKLFCEMDATLWNNHERLQNESGFDALCRLYVALTRPRQALYLLVDAADEQAHSNRARVGALIEDAFVALEGVREHTGNLELTDDFLSELPKINISSITCGQDDWLGEMADDSTAVANSQTALRMIKNPAFLEREMEVAAAPSQEGGLLADSESPALELGNAVHTALSRIETIESAAAPALSEKLLGDTPQAARVREILSAAFAKKPFAEIFQARAHETILRELPFDVLVDGTRVQGIIDRLHLCRDENGTVKSAVIFDFKSSTRDAQALYGAQLNAYAKAVSALWGLPLQAVSKCVAGYTDAAVVKLP